MERYPKNMKSLLALRKMNHALKLEPDGEIINLDYDPIKLYKILRSYNDGKIDCDRFFNEIPHIISSYITLRKQIFRIARYNNGDFFKYSADIFRKYRITDIFYNQGHVKSAITAQRLMLLFPHMVAKIVVVDCSLESIVQQQVLRDQGLEVISPACFWKSSFGLLPKHEDDVDCGFATYIKIIKSMLLAQYLEQDVMYRRNEIRAKITDIEKMQSVLMNCHAVYHSEHIQAEIRFVSFMHYFFKDQFTGEKYSYEKAAEMFDKRFSSLNFRIEGLFRLRPGTGTELFQDDEYYIKNCK